MWDLSEDPDLAEIVSFLDARGHLVCAVCHGPVGLLKARRGDGTPVVAGRCLSTFTDAEERLVGLDQVVPFLLQSRLAVQGGDVQAAPPWTDRAVRDGHLVTGQNPMSSASAVRIGAGASGRISRLEQRRPQLDELTRSHLHRLAHYRRETQGRGPATFRLVAPADATRGGFSWGNCGAGALLWRRRSSPTPSVPKCPSRPRPRFVKEVVDPTASTSPAIVLRTGDG